MKIYWADREGKGAPPGCTFHCQGLSLQRLDSLPPPTAPIKIIRRTYSPTRSEWESNVQKALKSIQKSELHKVVLARCLTLELATAPNPLAIAAALKPKSQGAFLFCLQSPTFSFLGATPERLFARKGNELHTEAIAGTRRRGKNGSEDERLKLQLLNSPKDLREFSFVQTYLQETLQPLADPIHFSPLSIHATQNVQHIYSRCTATLKKEVTDEELLHHLHPTPALCGMPKQKALQFIQKFEPFDRGLYGGVIGWKTSHSSEWIVAIRSCLIEGKTVKLYSGTGIVAGSDPQEEWEELDQKLKLYDGIFLDH